MTPPCIFLITGIPGSGKSTVARSLALRFPRSVHVRGDVFRRFVVNGRIDMTPDAGEDAMAQLELRYRLAASVSDGYLAAGFVVVLQDVVLGAHLDRLTRTITGRPLLVVVLTPSAEVVARRDLARGKTGYVHWRVEELDGLLRRETPRLGLWLDTSDQTVGDTVDEILARAWNEGSIGA